MKTPYLTAYIEAMEMVQESGNTVIIKMDKDFEPLLAEFIAIKEALSKSSVGQSLPKHFSGQAYRKAHSVMNYEEFVEWWDSV